jgi:Zn-dependent M28 family amino/carboxypeptidase
MNRPGGEAEALNGLEGRELDLRLRLEVTRLAENARTPGTEHHAAVAEYLVRSLSAINFMVRAERVGETALSGINIIADWSAEAKEKMPILVVAAHYDTMPDVPGADDNASSVAVLLEIARWLAPRLKARKLARRLQLAFYDLEEFGLAGSREHARALKTLDVRLHMIALEMLGFFSELPGTQAPLPGPYRDLFPGSADFLAVCGNFGTEKIVQLISRAMAEAGGPATVALNSIDDSISAWCRMSDHSSFWDLGFPAVMITDTGPFRNPNYHRSSDLPNTLNYRFLARTLLGLSRAVLLLLLQKPDGPTTFVCDD